MRTGFPCNESRFFPVGIDLQGFLVSYTGFGFAVRFKSSEPNAGHVTRKWALCTLTISKMGIGDA
jgi:hypothetical protein